MTFILFAVVRYLRRVAHERSGLYSHSRRHHPRTRTWEDHMLSTDSDSDKEVETGVFLHQLLEDDKYRADLHHDLQWGSVLF